MQKKNTHKTRLLGYHKSTISLFKSGQRGVSWPLAEKLCEIFPDKSIKEWKVASPAEISRAFEQIERERETA
jgi:uncharacterized membrane protein YfbV (UPF0208 family)